jgi:U3 small nucleolar RNA-associated protein MPP10
VLEFDQPGAATTEALAEAEGGARTLEEIITQRCKEALWDDVVRKAALRPGEFKPR